MAVPKYKRSVSAKEYWHTFKKIRTDIRNLLLEDFKVKTEMEDSMKGYPIWMLQHQGGKILDSLSVISACINRVEVCGRWILLYDELFIKPFLTGEYLEHHQITETEILMSKMQLI